MPRRPAVEPKEFNASLRFGASEKVVIETRMQELGVSSVGEYLRRLIHEDAKSEAPLVAEVHPRKKTPLVKFHATKLGTIWNGNSLDYMGRTHPKTVDLIVTSPPFGLLRKKTYGNEDAHDYCDWFRPFAEGFKKVLKDQGSLVIDVGGAWKKGMPCRRAFKNTQVCALKEYPG